MKKRFIQKNVAGLNARQSSTRKKTPFVTRTESRDIVSYLVALIGEE